MRILITSINYHPDLTGIGKYTGEMAEWLATQGNDVKVITAPPYYPAWKISGDYSGFAFQCEKIEGVSVIRCPLWVPQSPSGSKRILHLATFALTALPVMLWNALIWKPNLVFVIEPPLFCAPGAILAARIARCDSWLHVQDFEVDAAFELGLLKNPRLRTIVEATEKWLMLRFSRVSTISGRMLQQLETKGVPEKRRLLFDNWVDLDQIRPLDKALELRRELGIPEASTVLLYSGNMGRKQGLEILVDAAIKLREREDITFILCGDGVVRSRLVGLSVSCSNIIFLPLQPISHLNELLNLADIHLLPQSAEAEDLVMPSKLTNMLASGRPVIATAGIGSQVESVVSKCGGVVGPGDLDGFVKMIERFADDPNLRRTLGRLGREFAVQFLDKEKICQKHFQIISVKLTRKHSH